MLNRNFKIAILIGTLLSVLHLILQIYPLSLKNDIIFTPYTSWMGINSTHPISFLYFFIIPVIASFPSTTVYKEDVKNGTFPLIFMRTNKLKYFSTLYFYTFFLGAITVTIPLLINFILSFMFLPNINPDEIIHSNIGMYEFSTFFSNIYYTQPLLHVLISLLTCFLFGGVFATFSLSLSFYVKQIFVILLGSFLLQIGLMIINLFSPIPVAPIYYISEFHIYGDAKLGVSLIILLFIYLLSLFMYSIGVKNYAIR